MRKPPINVLPVFEVRGLAKPKSPWTCCLLATVISVIAIVGVYGSVALRNEAQNAASATVDAQFDYAVRRLTDRFGLATAGTKTMLLVLASMLAIFPTLSFSDFATVVRPSRSAYNQQAVQWAPLVLDNERQALEGAITEQLGRPVALQQLSNLGALSPRVPSPDYYPIAYSEPLVGSEAVMLLDLQTSGAAAPFLKQARDTGNITMSAPIHLILDNHTVGSDLGMVVFVPVFRKSCGLPDALTVSDRQRCIQGFVLGVWRFDDIFSSWLQASGHNNVVVQVVDVEAATPVFVGSVDNVGGVHIEPQPASYNLPASTHQHTHSVFMSGREFRVAITASPRFQSFLVASNVGSVRMIMGLLLTAVAIVLVIVARSGWHQYDRKNAALLASRLKQSTVQTARDTSNRIVGYVCHELRNPLHVLDTWFKLLLVSPGTSAALRLQYGVDASDCAVVSSTADRDAALQDVGNALSQMRCIVNDVLDFRAIEAGGLAFHPTAVNVGQCLLPTIKRGQAYLRPGVTLRYCVPKDLYASVDVQRLTQIVTNGLSNAGKFTMSGSVSVFVGVMSVPASIVGDYGNGIVIAHVGGFSSLPEMRQLLVVDVCNTGVGLPGDVERLFVPFKGVGVDGGQNWSVTRRCDKLEHSETMHCVWNSCMQRTGECEWVSMIEYSSLTGAAAASPVTASTGLGLPLSREFANVCGGWLDLEDDGAGNTHFWCVVPAPSAPHLAESAQSRSSQDMCEVSQCDVILVSSPILSSKVQPSSGSMPAVQLPSLPGVVNDEFGSMEVVVVDDELANRRVAQRFLLKLGVPREHITLLDSGETALSYLNDASHAPPSAVLLDISMGAKSGMDVMKELGVKEYPVIACTANVTDLDRVSYAAAGFKAVLPKPFTVGHLREALALRHYV